MQENKLSAFKGKNIRRVLHKEERWFSVIDVVEALTDSADPNGYIKKMRIRDTELAKGWGQIVTPLTIKTGGGKQRMNCANIEGVFRIIQSIPSPKAEPFKSWLAKVGYERVKEISEQENLICSGDEQRLLLRKDLAQHNKKLVSAAHDAGVSTNLDYAVFQDHGYKGLYGGLGAKEIHARKELKKHQKILDHMDCTELAANSFRITQTKEKLRRENIQGKQKANHTHLEVGEKVRQTIKELGGTMPEDLPTPEKSIPQLELEKLKKRLTHSE